MRQMRQPNHPTEPQPVSEGGGIDLQCPQDRARLSREGEVFACPACGRRFPIDRGVVRFLPETDAFYEGRYLYTPGYVPRRDAAPFAWPLWLMNSGYVWAVRRRLPAGATVLEMGCAGGLAYFARRYRVIGLDLSFASLANVAPLYEACLQADAGAIPLPDASVDGIISSYVWEHIPPGEKGAVLAECARVLRPDGALVFLYDVESRNPLYRRMKERDPALYREVLIEREGHYGWQTPAENREIFEAHGFRVRRDLGQEKLLISPAMYDKVQNWPGGLRRVAQMGLRFRNGRAFHAYNAGLRLFDETLGRLLPDSWSRVRVAVCEKRAA
jgi:SAM-dependent methyltransferase